MEEKVTVGGDAIEESERGVGTRMLVGTVLDVLRRKRARGHKACVLITGLPRRACRVSRGLWTRLRSRRAAQLFIVRGLARV